MVKTRRPNPSKKEHESFEKKEKRTEKRSLAPNFAKRQKEWLYLYLGGMGDSIGTNDKGKEKGGSNHPEGGKNQRERREL